MSIVISAAAFRAPDLDAGVASLVFDVNRLEFTYLAPLHSALVGATGLAALRTRVLPIWYGWASLVVALIALLRVASVARDGFFEPGTGLALISFLIFVAWTLTTSGLLVRRWPALVRSAEGGGRR
jgi:hypothetical protein